METPEETDSKLIKGPDNQNDFEDEEEEEKDSYGETLLQGRGEEEYSMINNPRGRAIIFNHYKYDPKLKLGDRKGTQQDEDKIKAALTNLKFQVELHENITFSEIQTVLKKVSKDDHSKYDCLIVIVMSHGKMSTIKETGKLAQILAYDQAYNEEELWKPFIEGEINRTLLGKPKLFFIQACRSGEEEEKNKGIWVPSKAQKEGSHSSQVKLDFYSIPDVADLLIARSTFDGCFAYRHKTKGSRFIQTLGNELEQDIGKEDDKKHDLLRILTRVNRIVAFNYPEVEGTSKDLDCVAQRKQMPNFYSTLTRMIIFKNVNPSDI